MATWVGAVGKNTAALLGLQKSAGTAGETGGKGARPPAKAKKGGVDPTAVFNHALMAVAGKFLVLLTPIAGLSHLLAQATSGFEPFMKTVKMVSMILASFMMPVFVVLGAYMLTFAGVLAAKAIPVLTRFAEWVARFLGVGEGGEKAGAGGKGTAGGPDMEFWQSDEKWHPKPGVEPPPKPKLYPGFPGAGERQTLAALVPKPPPSLSSRDLLPGFPGTPDGDRSNRENAARQGATTKEPGKPATFAENLKLMLAEMRRLVSAQPKLSDLAGVWKEALVAGLAKSPLDARMEVMQRQLIEGVAKGVEKAMGMT